MDDFHDQSLALPGLVGEECDQIWFVRDYVMVILEHRTITCGTAQIEAGGVRHHFPNAGSRDAICELINRHVRAAAQEDDGTVQIEFDDKLILRVSPFADDPMREFIFIAERSW